MPAGPTANDDSFDFTAPDASVANTSTATRPASTGASEDLFDFSSPPPSSLSTTNTFPNGVDEIFGTAGASSTSAAALESDNLQTGPKPGTEPDENVQITAPTDDPVEALKFDHSCHDIQQRFGFPLQWIMRATHALLVADKRILAGTNITVSLPSHEIQVPLQKGDIVGVHATQPGESPNGKFPRLVEGEVFRVCEVTHYYVDYVEHQSFSTVAFPNVWLPCSCVSTVIRTPDFYICSNVFCKAQVPITKQKCSKCQTPRERGGKDEEKPTDVFGAEVPKRGECPHKLLKEIAVAAASEDEPLVMLAMLDEISLDFDDQYGETPFSISYSRIRGVAEKFDSINCVKAIEALKERQEYQARLEDLGMEETSPKPFSELIPKEEDSTRPFDYRAVKRQLSVVACSKTSLEIEKARSLINGSPRATFNVITDKNTLNCITLEGGLEGDKWVQAQLTAESGTLYVHIFIRAHRSRRWRYVSRSVKVSMQGHGSPFPSSWRSLYCIPRQGLSGIRFIFKNEDDKKPTTIKQLRVVSPVTRALDKALRTPGMYIKVVQWLFHHADGLAMSESRDTLPPSPNLGVKAMFRNGIPAANEEERLEHVASFCSERGTYEWSADHDAELVRMLSARCRAKEIPPKNLTTMKLTKFGITGGKPWLKYKPLRSELAAYPLLRIKRHEMDSRVFEKQIRSRYYEICVLNHFVELLQPFVLSARALCTPTSLVFVQRSIAPLLRLMSNGRHLLLGQPHEQWHTAIMENSHSEIERESLTVRIKKFDGDTTVDQTYFGQCFAQIHPVSTERLLMRDQAWVMELDRAFQSSNTWGGDAIDNGGPYRDSFDCMCRDLMSDRVPLFTRTRNNVSNIGYDRRNAWMPNPGARDERSLEMFRFVGKLIGVAARTTEFLPLSLAPLVWAKLVGAPVTYGVLMASHLSVVTDMAEFAGLHARPSPHATDDRSPGSHSPPAQLIHTFEGKLWTAGGDEVSDSFINMLCFAVAMVTRL